MGWWVLKRRLHQSWLIAAVGLGVLIGCAVTQVTDGYFADVGWLLLSVIMMVGVFYNRQAWLVPAAILAGGLIGAWRGSFEQVNLFQYQPYYGRTITLTGTVSDDVTDSGGQAVVTLGDVKINRSLPGKVRLTTGSITAKRGDQIIVKGKMTAGFGSYAGVIYRGQIEKVVEPIPGDVARRVRDWFAAAVRKAIPEPQASLGLGYLVGQKSALPSNLTDALKVAGLTHVVVASGYNLTILVRLSRRLFGKISKFMAAFGSGCLIACFMAVTGLSPSMSRAGLVSGLSLLTWYYGRQFHPLILLVLAAAITTLFNPSYVWGDLGWMLSFLAFAGVMLVGPIGQAYFFGDKPPGTVRQILGETMAAHLVTAPVIMLSFGTLSNVAIFSNLLVLPLVPLAMLLTFIAGIAALIAPGIATIIGLPANWLLDYMVKVVRISADQPWAQTEFQPAVWLVIVSYVAMILVGVYMWRASRFNLRSASIVE
jgi:competence protein ComEC